MKLLTVVRHAKSSWKDRGLSDFQRPLNRRGERDAPRMAQRLAAARPAPRVVVSSPARRAADTAEALVEALGPRTRLVLLRDLYLAPAHTLLAAARELDDGVEHAALVGHNPGLTEFVNLLADAGIENVPTCGMVRLRFDVDAWREIDAGGAELLDFDTPKRAASKA